MRCGACGVDNRTGRRFCSACGGALGAACPACGAENEAGDRFCGQCGTALLAEPRLQPGPEATAAPEPAGELRPVTVLFSDLTGFTDLSNRLEPEAAGELLDAFFEVADAAIVRHGGTVDKHIGDCVMALFGAPIAHADDAFRAVAASLDVHAAVAALSRDRSLPGIGVHSGIATGTVMAARSGSGVRRDYTVIGPSVNLAARLCDKAEPGEILIPDDLARVLDGRFAFEGPIAAEIAGFDGRLAIRRVTGEAGGDDRRSAPLVGRSREARQFAAILETCLEARAGQAVLLRGVAGIGKTRLSEAFEESARQSGANVVRAAVLEFGGGRRQEATGALALGLLGLGADGPGDPAGQTAALAARGAIADEDRGSLAELLDLPVPDDLRSLWQSLAPDARRRRRTEALGRLARAAAADGPLMVIVEDVHWADPGVLAAVASVAAALARSPAVVLMTTRPDGDPIDGAWRLSIGETPLATIDLTPLGREEALQLAREVGAGDAGPLDDVVRRAEGNPLFLVQLVHHLSDLGRDALPSSIRSLVFARLDRLAPADKAVLQVASVLGSRFVAADLRALAGASGYDPAPLVASHMLKPSGDMLQFTHALIHEAVYESLPRSRRQALHREAAALVAGRDLLLEAEHLESAGEAAAAGPFLTLAREEARLGNFARGLSLIERGLRLAGDPDERFALLELRGETTLATGDVETARRSFEEAMALAGDDARRCRAEIGLAQCMRVTDALAEAEAMLAQAERRARGAGLALERSRIHHLRGNLMFPQGRLEDCLAEHKTALDLAREAGSVEAEVAALGGLGDANYAVGKYLSARTLFGRCVELARASGNGRVALANAPMLAITEILAGDPAAALATAEAALGETLRAGAVRPEMICRHACFMVAIEAGDTRRAAAEIERAEEIASSLRATRFQAENRAFLSWVLRCEGRRGEAARTAREGRGLIDEAGRNYMLPVVLGHIAASSDEEGEREAAIEEAREILSGPVLAHCHAFFYRAMIEADIDAGRGERALEWADAFDAASRGEPYPWADYVARWGRAMAARQGAGLPAAPATIASLAGEGRRLGFRRLADKLLEPVPGGPD